MARKYVAKGVASAYANVIFLFLTLIVMYSFINILVDVAKTVTITSKDSNTILNTKLSALLRIVNATFDSTSNSIYMDIENYGSHVIIMGDNDEVIVKYKSAGITQIEVTRDIIVYAIVYPGGTVEYTSSTPVGLPPKCIAKIVITLSSSPDPGKVEITYVHCTGASCEYVLVI